DRRVSVGGWFGRLGCTCGEIWMLLWRGILVSVNATAIQISGEFIPVQDLVLQSLQSSGTSKRNPNEQSQPHEIVKPFPQPRNPCRNGVCCSTLVTNFPRVNSLAGQRTTKDPFFSGKLKERNSGISI